MPLELFFKGLILGFAIAAPVGPIGLLCIQRTLSFGLLTGLVSGLGAATADAVYGFVAAFGLSLVTSFLVDQQTWLALVGGAFLCYLGVRTFVDKPAGNAARAEATGVASAYGSTFVLTLTNPMTILAFAAIFAGAGLATTGGSTAAAAMMVLGVFCGSTLWWLLLSGGVSLLRQRMNAVALGWVNRLAGVVILTFGLVAVARAFGM